MRAAWLVAFVVLSLAISGCLRGDDDADSPDAEPTGLAPALRHGGVVVAAHEAAAQAGAAMLRNGGNAFDAAAAVQFALNVVRPQMNGIGGGSFWVLHDARSNETVVIDGRETMPAGMDPQTFQSGDPPYPHSWMGYAAGTPGTLRAVEAVLERGNLSLSTVLVPAIDLARDGFVMYDDMFLHITTSADKLRSWPASAEVFLVGAVCPDEAGPCQGGLPPPVGTVLRQPDLAATLAAIAAEGPSAFYQGPVAQAMVDTVAARGGSLGLADLAGYDVMHREPLRFTYDGFEVATMPLPGGGLVVAQTLGIAHGLDWSGSEADRLHLTTEAMRLAYADRDAYLGDPAFVQSPAGLLDPAYLSERRALIDPTTARDPQPGKGGHADGKVVHDGGHTTHFVVVDGWGNVASVTSTIESVFGNGMVVPGYGFLLNNELTDFHPDPAHPNGPAAGKRPLSSMSPSIVFDSEGHPWAAVGSPGGRTIIATVADVLLNLLEHDMDLEAAVEATRIYPGGFPSLSLDRTRDPVVWQDLEARGHAVDKASPVTGLVLGQGNVHAILRDGDGWVGWADTRGHDGATIIVPRAAMG